MRDELNQQKQNVHSTLPWYWEIELDYGQQKENDRKGMEKVYLVLSIISSLPV